ncbi:hypothetical protein G6F23_016084 [Rhizopus arrhizus]|nr:hypothetical protein G6F23_016084 [Rhizopus arrhizus]
MVGLVVGRGYRGDQPDAFGDGRQRGQKRERFEMLGAGRARERSAVRVAHADRVGEEHRVEFGGLGFRSEERRVG